MSNTLKILRHSASELLALAVSSLFPKVQLVSGEATSLGFYYDFFLSESIDVNQLPFIEERMRDFMRQDLPIKVMEMMRKNAIELFKHHHQNLKVALLKANVETLVHICQIGHFYDLGYPPFVKTTKQMGAIKLINIDHIPVSLPGHPSLTLTRIQGTAFPDQASLKQFLKKAEEAKHRDHRLLGKEMHLFTTFDETCPGCWSWYPKGALIREILLDWWRNEHRSQKYQPVATPNLMKPNAADSQSLLVNFDNKPFSLCSTKAPSHALLFKSKLHSYRNLPIRYCECSEFYDPIKETHLWGLLRARAFTTDSVYAFCTLDQVLNELTSSLQFIEKIFRMFNFETHWHLISRNSGSMGSLIKWDESLDSIIKALKRCNLKYTLNGEGKALYGPKAEMYFTDSLGREWKGPYIYIDLYHPEKFGLHYQGSDDCMHVPVMIGRSMFGSIERLIAILVEHYAGVLPLWLAPEQVRVIPVTDKSMEYAAQVFNELEQSSFRASIDNRKENLGAKVHAAEKEKVPYLIVIGEKEEKNKTITLRRFLNEEVQEGIKLGQFLEQLSSEVSGSKKQRSVPQIGKTLP